MKAPSPYLTVAEAATYLKFSTTQAFRKWRQRHARTLPVYRRGGTLLFKQADLDAAVTPFVTRRLTQAS